MLHEPSRLVRMELVDTHNVYPKYHNLIVASVSHIISRHYTNILSASPRGLFNLVSVARIPFGAEVPNLDDI